MTAEDLEIIANSFWIPKADISVTEWAEANLYLSERVSSSAGPYSTMLTPYVREPLETFKDEKIRLMVLCWGAQTSKTTTILAGMGYRLDMKPTPTMWVMPNENLARSFSEYRWMPMVDDCPALARHKPNNPDRYKLMEQHFDKMSIWFFGSNSPANLASRSVGLLCCDETDKMAEATSKEANSLQLAEVRTKTYPLSLTIQTSTPTTEYGHIWQAFKRGDQRYFYVPCPFCGEEQTLEWPNVKWDETAKNAEGEWDNEKVRRSAYYECCKCKGKISDGHKTKMLRSGKWKSTNSNPEPQVRSYHLSGLYSPWETFGKLACQFLSDKKSVLGLQNFVNSVLAQPWVDIEEESQDIKISGAGYRMGEQWSECETRIISADIQEAKGFHMWVVVRGWKRSGESRLEWCGRLETWDALRALQLDWKVPDKMVFLDSGDQTRQVYYQACKWGWTCLLGSDSQSFVHVTKNGRIIRPYSTINWGDPLSGTNRTAQSEGLAKPRCPVIKWSNPAVKDILALLRGNKMSKWEIPDDCPEEWHNHMNAEVKRPKFNPLSGRTKMIWYRLRKENHLRDAECMNLTGAMLSGCMPVPDEKTILINDQNKEGLLTEAE